MKVMVLVKASNASEAGEMPSEELLTAMTRYNEELSKAGVLLAGEGLHPSSKAVRVHFSGKDRIVTDGPFAETKELIAGYWLWQVDTLQGAVEWLKRCPNPHPEDSVVEIRQVFEADDFGEALTPELRTREERLARQALQALRTRNRTAKTDEKPVATCKRTEMSNAALEAAAKGVSAISPYLTCDGAADAIEFYKKAFAAEELVRLAAPDGKIMHACLSINGASVMLGDDFCDMGARNPKALGGSPVTVHLIVDDADAWIARAEKAGAAVVLPANEMFWGDRYGVVKDPFGHSWSVSTPVRTLDYSELQAAAERAMAG